jgi:hypothetical protein
MPQPFSTIGMSDIELIEELQEMLWEMATSVRQRRAHQQLHHLIRSDVDDPDAFEFYPGARWPVDDDRTQVEPLQPPYQLAEVTLQAEALLKGDLQNVTSAAPFAAARDTRRSIRRPRRARAS